MESVDAEEIGKFERMAHEWWEPEGKFKLLHQINPLRTGYICQQLTGSEYGSLAGLRMVDIGCGGGILSEALEQRGARMVGIDRSEKIIGAARAHQNESGSQVDYRVQAAEDLAVEDPHSFDVVLAMEVLEHVPDVDDFIRHCGKLLKPEGWFFFATLNRTLQSWLAAIVGAEYILRWLPKGTHTFGKFVRPSELDQSLRRVGITMQDLRGMSYQPLENSFQLSNNPHINYLGFGRKG
ncbi:bifunctional 2-polyprenyl-6-hydroxyphenol methylase/3-demethylubiquinol 3-O-methyltransferase UbiG [Candidatus Magnetaquicoccus inordinatus]|uniref:bifunctional 2-polyprenyl-6-hydroxyphenol methylase/3-demethylubiquinol 3-O-methyltransferase UbiG n=1 Tax=Candidatus Magnetaquicoccus inordinatus TaxID=2496818 RepID=UPI00102C7300|nr:bifunctional 2-polyprenyl-6-hydroxyphenol methylase/3-demethylubiquinol 3-O-methyltransferase UbiG [Candidatus Magnetaquicoccus inordinatus]